jgi:drug/metabolite transporter (DMT)-like permease
MLNIKQTTLTNVKPARNNHPVIALENSSAVSAPPRALIILALFAVYFIWGSTYLAIAFAVQSFPPFFTGAIRFLSAGLMLFAIQRLRGAPTPSKLEFWNAARVGVLMIVGSVGLVTLTESWGAPSGVVATVLATAPVWAGIWGGLWGHRPRPLEWLGMLLGLIGVALLALEGGFQANILTLIVFIAPMCWSLGSIWAKHLTMPAPAMASALEMLCGGVVLAVIGYLWGEQLPSQPTFSSLIALAYLTVFGSLVAFSAYLFLLENVRPTVATSFAYVNPIVALGLGFLVSEPITIKAALALPVILLGMAAIGLAQRPSKETS